MEGDDKGVIDEISWHEMIRKRGRQNDKPKSVVV